MAATTWNPSDKGASITLSGGNLTAQVATVSSHGVRATSAIPGSGKWYWEIHVDTLSGVNLDVGVADATASLTAFFGGDAHGLASIRSNGFILYNNVDQAAGSFSPAQGDIISVAFDAATRTVVFRLNNAGAVTVLTANVPSGTLYPVVGGNGNGGATTYTANFGATAFTYLPPAGYTGLDSNLLSYTVPVTGGVQVGGTAPVSISFTIYVPSGGVVVGGAGVVTDLYPQHYTIVPVGGVIVGGDQALIGETHVLIFTAPVSGGVIVGGTAPVKEVIAYVPSGGVMVGGTAPVIERIAFQPSGGVLVGGSSAPVAVVFVPAPSGGVIVGGAAALAFRVVPVPSGGVQIGGAALVRDFQAWFNPSGGVKVGGTAIAFVLPVGAVVTPENPYNDDFPGWAINLETGAPSRYLRMPANSWTQMGGKTYVANAAGVYEVGATSDAGQPIRAAVLIGQSDYGSEQNKRVPDVVVSARMAGRLRLRVSTNTGSKHYYSLNPSAELSANRVKLGKGLEGRFWSWMLENEADGGDFEIESLAFSPEILKRLGK